MWRTTRIGIGKSAGQARAKRRSASTPPAEAPTTTMSQPLSGITRTFPAGASLTGHTTPRARPRPTRALREVVESCAVSRVVVTGGAGKAGRATVRDLVDDGRDVLSVDLVMHPDLPCEQLVADLTDYGETVDALKGAEA